MVFGSADWHIMVEYSDISDDTPPDYRPFLHTAIHAASLPHLMLMSRTSAPVTCLPWSYIDITEYDKYH